MHSSAPYRKPTPLGKSFNSLFEMQNLLSRLASVDERVSFNSLFEMLPLLLRNLVADCGDFQFSI